MTGERSMPGPWTGAWLTVAALAVCIAAFAIATGFVPATTRYFPLIVSAAGIVVALADLARRGLAARRARSGEAPAVAGQPEPGDFLNEAASAPPAAILRYAAWFFGYLAGIWLVSLIVASGLFVAAFLWREARMRWWAAILSGVVVVGLVILAGKVFYIRWPASLLEPLKPLL
jgi:hypothetical protein